MKRKAIFLFAMANCFLFFIASLGNADDFDVPFDVNPQYEMVYIKQRAEENHLPSALNDILGMEGWSIQGNTLYGYFDDDNIKGLTASQLGSITLDGSLGISNVQIAVDFKDLHDFQSFDSGGEPLRIGSVTNVGGNIDSVTTFINIEGPIRY
jgi:hypothetical protein